MARTWKSPSVETVAAAERLLRDRGVPRPAALSLARRGLHEEDRFESFLNPRLNSLADPRGIPGIERGVARAWEAIDRGEPILVHGDYDVDGITGTAFLTRTLRGLGGRVHAFVPNRDEGYGLGDAGIAAAREVEAGLVITVDCGTSSHTEIAALAEHGIEVVVLDHHSPGDTLPDAVAVVNPRCGEEAGFGGLAAVGVAAKFLHAMALVRPDRLDPDLYKDALQLVALGTIADVVPLLGENRILVSFGLRRLAGSSFPGIQALKAVARLGRGRVSATDVAFLLAPRLNAMGRMGEARDALALLLAEDTAEAWRLAERMEELNAERKEADRRVLDEALEQLRGVDPLPPVIVLASDTWPVGVVGIAANRLLDRFRRPVLLVALEGETGRGSARSPVGFDLPPALAACADLLEEHGGHARAAGFTIRRGNFDAFRERLERIGAESMEEPEPEPWDLDATVELAELSPSCVDWLERLEPFGQGNPEPLYGARSLRLAGEPDVVGKGHLRLSLADDGARLRGIAFGLGDRRNDLARAKRVDAVFHAAFDTFRGTREVRLVVRDVRPAGEP